jgi:hypothetical protein
MRFALLGVLLFLAPLSLLAQFETAEVLGTVRDNSDAVVAGVQVTLTNQETNIETKTVTDAAGNYSFFNVKVGTYTVTMEHAGFTKFTTKDVLVEVNARQRVDAKLSIGQVTDSVTVNGAAEVLSTDTSEYSQIISTQQIAELPLNGRDYANLALLSTNVHVSPIAATFAPSSTPREAAFNVNGMRSTYNNFLLDGIDNNSYGTSNQDYSSQVVQPSPDAVEEFKVITSNFSAEYGRVGGGIVNAALRSGTNEVHGTVYEFMRNTDLNAIGYIFGQRSPTFQKPTLNRNQFGATIGGPFIKNKLFFFGDYEGYRQAQHYLNFYSEPNMNDRIGILPDAVENPVTGALYPANTQIPLTAISPFALAALSGIATPNFGSASSRSNNLEELIPVNDNSDKYDAKLDYQIASNMTSFLRFSQRKDLEYFGPADPGPSGGDGNGYIHSVQQQAGAGYTWKRAALSGRGQRRPGVWNSGTSCGACGRFPHPDHRRLQQPDHRTANHQSAVSESDLVRSQVELLPGQGPALHQNGIRIRGHPHRGAGHQPALRLRHLRRAVQQAAGSGDLFHFYRKLGPGRFLLRSSQPDFLGQRSGDQSSPAGLRSVRTGRLARELEADGERRAALGVCHAAV